MNILFLFYAPMLPYIGGIQRMTENLAIEMSRRGHEVCYLCNNRKDINIKYDFPVPQFYLDDSLAKDIYFESYRKLLFERNIDVVINQEPREDMLELLSQTPEYIKRITCLHTKPFLSQGNTRHIMKYYKVHGLKSLMYRTICRLFPTFHAHQNLMIERNMFNNALKVSDRLCFESEKYIPRVLKYIPVIDKYKLIAVNNPNSFPLIEHDDIKKNKTILWVGRQTNSPKNVPLFIDFWVHFQKRNADWKAIVVGVGPDLEYNKRYAEQKKAQNIEFLGYVKDVAFYYKMSTFFMMTSIYEGFPMVLLEAMNNGCIPCVFDTFESLHDIIDDEVNGIIVPRYDLRLMVARIERLLKAPLDLTKMRVAAIEKTKYFTVDKIVDKWETIFNTL